MERHLVGHVAAVSVGIIDGRKLLDLDYSRGLARRGRLQRRRHRRRHLRRAPGHGRGQAVRPGVAGRAAGPRQRRPRAPVRGADRGAGDRPPLIGPPGCRTCRSASSSRRAPGTSCASCATCSRSARTSSSSRRTTWASPTNPRRPARRSRRTPGSRRASTPALRPPDPRRRLRPRGRCARRRARACARAATPGLTRRTTANNAKLLAALAGRPAERAWRALRVRARPRAARRVPGRATASARSCDAARAAAASRPGPRETAGSATTRSSSPSRSRPGGRTLGEWSAAEKNAISHRSRAARRMAPVLRELGF